MNGLQYHIVAYIGPDEGDMVALYYDTNEHLNLVCNGAHRFVRILKKPECRVSGLPRFENLDIWLKFYRNY